MATVRYEPFGTVVEILPGETIFAAARRAGVAVPTACGGKGTCGLCRVRIVAGESSLSAYTVEEKRHLGNTYFISKLRLACRLQVRDGDVVVHLPDADRARGAGR